MNSGPKLYPKNEESILSFHEKILLQGEDQSVNSSNSPSTINIFKEFNNIASPEMENSRVLAKLDDSGQSLERKKELKKDFFFREVKKVKMVKKAVTKLTSQITRTNKLKKINYQIIGDPVTETKSGSLLDRKFSVK